MIRGLLRGSTTLVELGSSLGVTSAYIAALMAPGGHLVCVEANPRLLPGLCERLARRAGSLRVDFVHARSPAIAATRSSPSRPRR
jgi:predicted O-methyltransferase YrrM